MIGNALLTEDIPRGFTALAEWLACMVYLSEARRGKGKGSWTFWGISLGFLAVMLVFLVATDNVPLLLWIPCMLGAILLMLGLICCNSGLGWLASGYCCVRAFLLAEFAASLEWQLYCYQVQQTGQDPLWLRLGFLAVSYSLVFGAAWYLERRWISPSCYSLTTGRELFAALVIGIAAFVISNLSFVYVSTPFSTSIVADIYIIRTLVDLGGLAILYAYHIQRNDLRSRYELQTINTLLESQYAQYRQSRESIALVNQKYHDLKHQIAVLRQESDSSARNAYLDHMEEEIRSYEAQNKTGNDVLDTVITGKALSCQQHHITLTCVADGSLLSFMDTMDICTIFGNALDNAIEYERTLANYEKRLIQLSVSRQRGFLMISISNYFEGHLEFEDGLPQTTKGDRAFHGYGVKSIHQTARKYGGTMAVDTSHNLFSLRVLIPLPEEG